MNDLFFGLVLHNLFEYRADGVLLWRVDRRCGYGRTHVRAGDVAGTRRFDGYWKISIGRKQCYRHILIWVMHTGRWPVGEIDHKDRTPGNDWFENLQEVTSQQNKFNSERYESARGTTLDKRRSKWVSQIVVNGKHIYIGQRDTEEEAHQLYLAAKAIYHIKATTAELL